MKDRKGLKAAQKRAYRKHSRKNRKYVPYKTKTAEVPNLAYAGKNSPDSLMIQL